MRTWEKGGRRIQGEEERWRREGEEERRRKQEEEGRGTHDEGGRSRNHRTRDSIQCKYKNLK